MQKLIGTLNIPQRKEFLAYAKDRAEKSQRHIGDFRALLAYRDRAYQRQLNVTEEHLRAVRDNMRGTKSRALQDLTVPIAMPQVESAVAYQAGVFLTSSPIFGVVSYPENMDQALAFETALADQSIRFSWVREFLKTFRAAFRYNFGPMVVQWKKYPLAKITTSTSPETAGLPRIETDERYGGCFMRYIDPYNCFMDMSVQPANLQQDGEFFGWNEIMSRVQLKKLMSLLDPAKTTHAREAYESQYRGGVGDSTSVMNYYVPDINRMLRLGMWEDGNGTDWSRFFAGKRDDGIAYHEHYLVTHFYCQALPADFGAPGNSIKTYHGILVNWSTVIFVEEVNTAIPGLPCLIAQPYEDGLGYQTQSLLDNALPFQDMSSALWNFSLEGARRSVFDRLLYNPSLVNKSDIDPVAAVSRIPLRNANMASDPNIMSRAIYQIPYRNDAAGINLQMAGMISQMADEATGQNKVDRGQFQKGNKTKTEFETVMGNSNSRQQLAALTLQSTFIAPLKEMVKALTLQYQPSGKLLSRDNRQIVEVDPVALREAVLEFKLTDGLLPAEKMMNAELLTVFMQTAQAIPAVQTEYDVLGMFMYWAKLRGAYWLEDFKRNPEQQNQFLQTMQATAAAQNPPPPQAAMQPGT